MTDASTTCTVHADGGVCNKYAAAPMISASGTVPLMAPVHVGIPWLATATFVASSPWGDASDDVTLVADGTQQYRWGSSHATSEWGLCTTFPRDAALEAMSSGDRTTLDRYTACGLQARSHPQIDFMASWAWYTPLPKLLRSRKAGIPPQTPAPLRRHHATT